MRFCVVARATGWFGCRREEGYRTRHYDAHRPVPLPTHERPNGSAFDGARQHPEYDPAYPAGYETASTGFIMVGAREYDPEIGRFLQPDPRPTGPELQWGQLNRWAYCANDPVNASDPTGRSSFDLFFGLLYITVGIGLIAASVGAIFSTGGLGALEPHIVAMAIAGLAAILEGIALLLDHAGEGCLADTFHAMAAAGFGLAAFATLGWGTGIGQAAAWIPNMLARIKAGTLLVGGGNAANSIANIFRK